MRWSFMEIISNKKVKLWFTISIIIFLIGLASLFIWNLKPGIDFKGGTLLELQFNNTVDKTKVSDSLNQLDFLKNNFTLQKTGDSAILIKSLILDKDQVVKVESQLTQSIGTNHELRLETVGPSVSNSLKNKAIWALILASIAIILYIAYAFNNVPKPASSWRFGVSAVIALLHDLLITIGVYSLLSHLYGFEVNSLFITALLTVMGFSVHDTIVVFDRIRENLRKFPSKSFEEVSNISVNQTLGRSLSTSLTLIIVLTTMLVLGGPTITSFIAVLLTGVTIGTYSSIFTATPILLVWQNRVNKVNKG
jgi:preprotein translocase subunit SecF